MELKMMKLAVVLAVSAGCVAPASAAIILTTGSGSAVTTVQGAANFESVNALTDNPYVEGGMSFSRTNLTFNNNGCGYAGCAGAFPGFSGNYMYGVGPNGYFDIKSVGSAIFSGLEFVIANGYVQPVQNVTWEAFLNDVLVGSGSSQLTAGSVVGFKGDGGFDTLRYTSLPTFGNENAPAFDSVRAQFGIAAAVPEPAAWLTMILGFAFIGAAMRRRKPQARVTFKFA